MSSLCGLAENTWRTPGIDHTLMLSKRAFHCSTIRTVQLHITHICTHMMEASQTAQVWAGTPVCVFFAYCGIGMLQCMESSPTAARVHATRQRFVFIGKPNEKSVCVRENKYQVCMWKHALHLGVRSTLGGGSRTTAPFDCSPSRAWQMCKQVPRLPDLT
jgi:hypothetical protein